MGSRLGGLAELVRDNVDGLLLSAAEVGEWRAVLQRLSAEPELVGRLRRGIQPPRTMHTVATEMANLYQRLLATAQA